MPKWKDIDCTDEWLKEHQPETYKLKLERQRRRDVFKADPYVWKHFWQWFVSTLWSLVNHTVLR